MSLAFPRVLSSSRTHLRSASSSESELSAISKLTFAEEEEYYGMYEDASSQPLPDLKKIQWELVPRSPFVESPDN